MAEHRMQLLTVEQVTSILNVSKSGVWSIASKEADFPKPFKLSAKQTRRSSPEVEAYILEKMDTRDVVRH